MKCSYSIMRYVPNAVAGEFVNVGLIVGSDESGEYRVEIISSKARAEHLAERRELDSFWSYLKDLKSQLATRQHVFSSKWLSEICEESGNLLQYSMPAPMEIPSLDQAADYLASRFLLSPVRSPRQTYTTKRKVVSEVSRTFSNQGLRKGKDYALYMTVHGKNYEEKFDVAVMNGRILQLNQAWNFQQSNIHGLTESIKAWAWTVQDIRENGGAADIGGKKVKVQADVDINAVYLPPRSKRAREALQEARQAFKDVETASFPWSNVDKIGRKATDLLNKAGST